ncbi:MAG: response regulator [Candidatus Omnitrophica bacterium]|nr:response regulator [Candidatus Omnitrophota bacterium]
MAEQKKILVADDDEIFLKLVDNDMTGEGYVVITARNGREALSSAKSQKPDLILLDINMPDMNGGEVGEILKSDPRTKDIPVIFLTGLLTKQEEESRGNMIGGNYFVAKPYNLQALLEEIRTHL